MNRIDKKFKELKKGGKKAFIAFITAGYPALGVTAALVKGFDRAGVDIIELGVPFSDPMADGPVIQESSHEALKNKVSLKKILRLVSRVRKSVSLPICLMTYYNPVFTFGDGRFLKAASSAGVDGLIIPDLPPEEAKGFMKEAKDLGIDVICFISPTTSGKRIKYISGKARGFLYYVSLTGVTGARSLLPPDLKRRIKEVKVMTDKPVCVGFGVSTPAQVKEVSRIADGVIVGSAIVKKIKENKGSGDLVKKVTDFVSNLRGA